MTSFSTYYKYFIMPIFIFKCRLDRIDNSYFFTTGYFMLKYFPATVDLFNNWYWKASTLSSLKIAYERFFHFLMIVFKRFDLLFTCLLGVVTFDILVLYMVYFRCFASDSWTSSKQYVGKYPKITTVAYRSVVRKLISRG